MVSESEHLRLLENSQHRIIDQFSQNDLSPGIDKTTLSSQVRYFYFFFKKALESNNTEIIIKILPWMYHAYSSQGFRYDDFLTIYNIFIQESNQTLQDNKASKFSSILEEIKQQHEQIILQSKNYQSNEIEIPDEYKELQLKFKTALINGDISITKEMFSHNINSFDELIYFYNKVVYPSMVQVGYAWQDGIITPAQEHLATSIVIEIITLLYTKMKLPKITKGKIVISTVINEFHELGAMMLANSFELDGWDVTYVGIGHTQKELLKLIETLKPDIIGLSVAVPFNLDNMGELIKEIKSNNQISKIMVGGGAFANEENIQTYGADFYLKDINEAIKVANMWYENEK